MAGTCGTVVAHAVVEHFPDDTDIGRIEADQLRANLVVQHVDEGAIAAGAAGGVLAFAPADQPVVGLDAQDGGVERRHLTEVAAVLLRGFDRYANPPCLDVLMRMFIPGPAARVGGGRAHSQSDLAT